MALTALGRRVLGSLPVWAEDEAAHVEAEGGPEVSVRAYPLDAFVARLGEDGTFAAGAPSSAQVEALLHELATAGYCTEAEDGWRMTREGFEALHEPDPADEGLLPEGPALLDLHPARHDSGAQG